MAYQISPLPVAPTRQDPVNFSARADAFVAALPLFRKQANDLALYVEATLFASEQAANATLWDANTAYVEGQVVYSPITYLSYRRKIAGTTPTDPSNDTTNWVLLSGGSAQLTDLQTQVADHETRITDLEAAPFDASISISRNGSVVDAETQSINFIGSGLTVNTDGAGNVNLEFTGVPIGLFSNAVQVTPTLRNINIVSDLGSITSDGLGNATLNFEGELATNITNDVTSDTTLFPALASNVTGSFKEVKVSNTKLSFNPSTGTLFSTIFNSSSDIRLKKNLSRVELGKIDKLTGFEFEWKDGSGKSSGVIAQEVEIVFPHLVQDSERGKTVQYDGLVAYLIEEVKSLKKRVLELERGE